MYDIYDNMIHIILVNIMVPTMHNNAPMAQIPSTLKCLVNLTMTIMTIGNLLLSLDFSVFTIYNRIGVNIVYKACVLIHTGAL